MFYFIIALFGLIFGSFFNVCIYRIPRGESIAFPGSHCTSCGAGLKWYELFPVFSYMFLGGKCKNCKKKISIIYPVVEVLTAVLFVITFVRFGLGTQLLFYVVLFSVLIIETFIDIKHYEIYDLPLLIAFTFAIVFNLTGLGIDAFNGLYGVLAGGGILLLVSLISFLIYKKEGMGLGDAKLLGVAGMFLGLKLTLFALFSSVIIGGVVCLLLLLFKIKKRGDYIPFGPFISMGVVLSVLYGNNIINWYIHYII